MTTKTILAPCKAKNLEGALATLNAVAKACLDIRPAAQDVAIYVGRKLVADANAKGQALLESGCKPEEVFIEITALEVSETISALCSSKAYPLFMRKGFRWYFGKYFNLTFRGDGTLKDCKRLLSDIRKAQSLTEGLVRKNEFPDVCEGETKRVAAGLKEDKPVKTASNLIDQLTKKLEKDEGDIEGSAKGALVLKIARENGDFLAKESKLIAFLASHPEVVEEIKAKIVAK